jgi:hypothetical protein
MILGSIIALMMTIVAHVFVDLSLAETAIFYFGAGALTMLLIVAWSRISFTLPKTASLTK